jgi:transcriptional regulator with XRE-family HTH domain
MALRKVKANAGRRPRANIIDGYVGKRVRMRRLMLEMTQTDLANKLGLTFQQVQKYEKGTNRIGSGRLHLVAAILKVPITFFFDGAPGATTSDGKAHAPTYVSDFLATRDGLALAKALGQIKDAGTRRRIVHLVECVANGGLA